VDLANRERNGDSPLPRWSLNRLRDSAATEIRRQFGLEGLMTMLLERARRRELPEVALQYHAPETRELIALCRELQQEVGDEPFFLATTTIEKLFDLNRMRAWRWLQGLARDGVLECVDRGSSEERRPGRFRYLGD
jgi:hypothetical protein